MLEPQREAQIRYEHSEFVVMRPGDFVRCAVTGQQIPLDQLKYWDVDRQEAYASPEIASRRAFGDRVKG